MQPPLVPEIYPPVVRANLTGSHRSELSFRRVLLHLALFWVTAVTTTITGAYPFPSSDSLLGVVFGPALRLVTETARGNFGPLGNGLLFTFTLLMILAAHEFGHYFACRHYGIRATLPFFIPAPPSITLFGTFGAVIRIKEPILSRRALFDIGIAGPLAGFAFALPASIIGLMFAKAALPSVVESGGLRFNDPLLFVVISKLLGVPKLIDWNPIYWAAWGALLVTALNLFPVGQLDGGHVLYSVVGRRAHRWISRIVAVACGTLAVTTFVLHQPPVYLLWTLVLLFLIKVGHPPVVEEEPIGVARVILAVIALLVFLLCFHPTPITFN